MSARRALLVIWQILFGLTAASVARAAESPLNLAVWSQCPSRELIESQLAAVASVRAARRAIEAAVLEMEERLKGERGRTHRQHSKGNPLALEAAHHWNERAARR